VEALVDEDQPRRIKVELRFGHACWPPAPACSLNQINTDSGIPFDSIRSEKYAGIPDYPQGLAQTNAQHVKADVHLARSVSLCSDSASRF
jgi:hypothetical protein